jgi:hypothetical protein
LTITQNPLFPVIKTTLYLSKDNKEWLSKQPKNQRTKILNMALSRIQEEREDYLDAVNAWEDFQML